jgi:hypothetical protein
MIGCFVATLGFGVYLLSELKELGKRSRILAVA